MKWRTLLLPFVAVFALAVPAQSQTLVGMYYRCDTADEGEADLIMNTVLSGVFDRHAEAGEILGWGWIRHQAGGPWRRIATITAPDRSTLTASWAEIMDEIRADHPNAWHRFNEICGSHDDYIWTQLASDEASDPGDTPDSWVSTYWVCNESTESRADELMQQMSPVFDKHIAAGHLGGWGWYEHEIGGRFRRLLTLASAPDFDLLEGREMAIDELRAEHADVVAEFGTICNGHADYIWANARTPNDN